MVPAQETVFKLRGQKIAAKIWNKPQGIPTLALHGWLDNAATFDRLAPLIPKAHIVAIDLPGHGLSDHHPPGTIIHMIDFVINAIEVANHLGWKKFMLLGHSLGSAIGSLVAGTIPSRIQGAILIDGLGPLTTPAEFAPHQLRLFIEEMTAKPHKSAPRYKEQKEALKARLKVNTMQEDSAHVLVERGTKYLDDGQWTWRTDPRLLMPSPLQLTEEQVLAFLKEITAPVCIIRPEPGFPFPPEIIKRRLAALKNVQINRLAGHHHVHLDEAKPVAEFINTFLDTLEGA